MMLDRQPNEQTLLFYEPDGSGDDGIPAIHVPRVLVDILEELRGLRYQRLHQQWRRLRPKRAVPHLLQPGHVQTHHRYIFVKQKHPLSNTENWSIQFLLTIVTNIEHFSGGYIIVLHIWHQLDVLNRFRKSAIEYDVVVNIRCDTNFHSSGAVQQR